MSRHRKITDSVAVNSIPPIIALKKNGPDIRIKSENQGEEQEPLYGVQKMSIFQILKTQSVTVLSWGSCPQPAPAGALDSCHGPLCQVGA